MPEAVRYSQTHDGTLTRATDDGAGIDFVLSTEHLDRYGDVVAAEGWQLAHFRRNPIALFNHNAANIVGVWDNVRVEGKQLLGTLRLAAAGTSQLIDSIRSLVGQGVIKAVSVGFLPKASEPLDPDKPWNGQRYTRSELIECSLVATPANPHALQVARAMGVPQEIVNRLFVEPDGQQVRDNPGATAATHRNRATPMNIAQRIQAKQQELAGLREDLGLVTASFDDNSLPEAEAASKIEELGLKIEGGERDLAGLQRAEATIARAAQPVGSRLPMAPEGDPAISRVGNLPASPASSPARQPGQIIGQRQRSKGEMIVRLIASTYAAHLNKQDLVRTVRGLWPDDNELQAVSRAVTNPADTMTTGWAKELVATQTAEFLDILQAYSVYARLSALGLRVNFGRFGSISIPGVATQGKLAGSFIAEGAPIPVKSGVLASVTLTPHKMAVISVFTRELAMASNPNIESVIRDLVLTDTANSLDAHLLDNVAADASRPAGLLNAAAWGTVSNPSSGSTLANIAQDIKTAMTPLVTANAMIRPVIILNPLQVLGLQFALTALGQFPFQGAANSQSLMGSLEIIASTNVPAGTAIVLDASSFASAAGDTPEFDVSEQATIHMADDSAAPLVKPITGAGSTPGTPAITDVAGPVRSLWQTASVGVRMMLFLTWAMRRKGVVSVITGITW